MSGIKALGVYVPKYRLGKDTAGWNLAVERSVCNFDEDSITMAVAAAIDCLKGFDRNQIDSLYFATTSQPYVEKQGAAIISEALDLRGDVFTTDVTGSLRSGTSALRQAVDSVNAGSARHVLVIASDCRPTLPRSSLEPNIGDGAVAILVSNGNTPVGLEHVYSANEYIMDIWRVEGEAYLRSSEERFMLEEGYERVLSGAVTQFCSKYKLAAKDFARAVFSAPDGRRHQEMGKKLGFTPQQVQEPFFGKLGNTGTAFVLMLLVATLEEAKPGDKILLANYGDGADVMSLDVGQGIEKTKTGLSIRRNLESKAMVPSYETYAKWRNFWVTEGARRPADRTPSIAALWRETEKNVRLYGVKCNSCGYVQYPPQRVCTKCQSKDDFTKVRLSDQRGKVFTYSMDYLAGTMDVPLVVAVINLDGGGRVLSMMTDRDISQVKVDMAVEFSFRKLRSAGGVHNYYWKSVPIRG